jgi:hypothetical protein
MASAMRSQCSFSDHGMSRHGWPASSQCSRQKNARSRNCPYQPMGA